MCIMATMTMIVFFRKKYIIKGTIPGICKKKSRQVPVIADYDKTKGARIASRRVDPYTYNITRGATSVQRF